MSDTGGLGSISPQDLEFYMQMMTGDQQNAQVDHLLAALRGHQGQQYTTPGGSALGGLADMVSAYGQKRLMSQQGNAADQKLQAIRDYTRQAGLRNSIDAQTSAAAAENRGGMPPGMAGPPDPDVLANNAALQKMEDPPQQLGMDLTGGDGMQAQQFSPEEVGNRSPEQLQAILELLRGAGQGGGF